MAWTAWNSQLRRWEVVEHFDPEEAEAVAGSLGLNDTGAKSLMRAAEEARNLNEERGRDE